MANKKLSHDKSLKIRGRARIQLVSKTSQRHDIPNVPLVQFISNAIQLELKMVYSHVSLLSNKTPFKIIGKLKRPSKLI